MTLVNNKKLPLVVIFGRTNVGKSTLFNCLIEQRKAIISEVEGTTRDSNIGEVSWRGKNFRLIDTGGIINFDDLTKTKETDDDIQSKVQLQAYQYLKKADLIIFLTDVKSGLLPQDKKISLIIKKNLPKKANKIILVVNKADSPKERTRLADFYKLSLGDPVPVSAVNGSGTGDLLDLIVKKIPKETVDKTKKTKEEDRREDIGVIIIGKPNVGKSSLLNKLIDEERVIVSSVAHTTREPQDTSIIFKNNVINLVDTAGISKKGRQKQYKKSDFKQNLEKHGITKSLKSLDKADIVLLLTDVTSPITQQDAKLIEEIIKRKKSLIIVANKWDLIKTKDTKKYVKYINNKLPYVQWAPIHFASALTGSKVDKIFDLILQIKNERETKIDHAGLASLLSALVKIHKPPKGRGNKPPRIHSLKQIKSNPPEFELKIGAKDSLHSSYPNFISNRLRAKYGFLGTPITIKVVKNTRIFS